MPRLTLGELETRSSKILPKLSTHAHHGSDRTEDACEISKNHLVITSYGTLVRDLELFEPISFLCVIGDEAQPQKPQDSKCPGYGITPFRR